MIANDTQTFLASWRGLHTEDGRAYMPECIRLRDGEGSNRFLAQSLYMTVQGSSVFTKASRHSRCIIALICVAEMFI